MLAILPANPSRGRQPVLGELPEPTPGPGEVLIEIAAAGLNRADLLQLRGLYPPQPGESTIPGLECAGRIAALGEGVGEWRVGEPVMALLAGGGHAERVAAPAGQLLPLPEKLTSVEGAALPEAALTAWTNLVVEGGLTAGQSVLITGATSGVGSFAVQLARELGARVLTAGRDAERLERLRPLGAEAWVLLDETLPQRVLELTSGHGVDLVLDLVGGGHLARGLSALVPGGRWVAVGLMAGAQAEIDLGILLGRRLRLIGSTLRSRSRAEKSVLVWGFRRFAEERFADGRLRPVIDRVFPFSEAEVAYGHLARGRPFGKVVLRLD